MNIFNRVTLATLRKNRVRTVVTIIGIMLSAAMICAVTTFISSLQNFGLLNMIYMEGDWHGNAQNAGSTELDRIASSDKVFEYVYDQQLGYSKLEKIENSYKPYLFVIGAGEGFDGMMPVHLSSGRYPQNQTEILLPEHLLSGGGMQYGIGDTITLELGSRMLEGEELGQNEPCYTHDDDGNEVFREENLSVRETRTYTVVGIYERPSFEGYTAPGYTALTLADRQPAESAVYDVYFKMHNAVDVYDFMSQNQFSGTVNNDVLMFSGVAKYNSFYNMLYGLAGIVIALIMFGSVSLIYNAFSISVSERTKQFGLLSSVGATRRQLRGTVLFEAVVVSAIGIPFGILVGIGGIGVTLLLIGNKFTSILGGSTIPMRICVSPASVIIACAVAMITVLISAWIPSKRATSVSAVEAIRQTGDIKVCEKRVKTGRLVYRVFGLPGMLASKHYQRSRKKYRSTVVSLFMSIVLFISASAFTEYLTESVEGGFSQMGYDLSVAVPTSGLGTMSAAQMLEYLREDPQIQGATYTQRRWNRCEISRSDLTDDFIRIGVPGDSSDRPVLNLMTYFVNDDEFRALLKQYHLNEQDYMNVEKPLAIALDGNTLFSPDEERFVTIHTLREETCEVTSFVRREIEGYTFEKSVLDDAGNRVYRYINDADETDVLELTEEEAHTARTLRSGKTIYDKPWFVDSSSELIFLYPQSVASAVVPETRGPDTEYTFLFTSGNHSAAYQVLKNKLAEIGIGAGLLNDFAERAEQNRNVVTIIQVFAYGFIVLISLIAAANVFNTISTNISLRRREFAMLKSVGMTGGGFNRMMNYECLLYGTRALLWGLPVSALITFLIYRTVSEGYQTSFHLPWLAIGIAVLSVFAVVFVTMMYAMRKIKKDNPIDALKNENL